MIDTLTRNLIQGKLNECDKRIKSQNRLPKSERDPNSVIRAKLKQKIYKKWLDEK